MQRLWYWIVLFLVVHVSGCQRQPDAPTTVAAKQPTDAAVVQQRDKKAGSTIEIADVLDALQMNIWKTRVNEDGNERIRKVSLCIKPKGGDPKTVATFDLPDEGPGRTVSGCSTR